MTMDVTTEAIELMGEFRFSRDRGGLVRLRRQAVRPDAGRVRPDGAVHGAGRGERQAHRADAGAVRLPVVGGGGGRRRRGAGGPGEADGVAGAGRTAHRAGRLAA